MQDVVGGTTSPARRRRRCLGPCRVIPQEFPGISCRVIDLEPPRGRFSTRTWRGGSSPSSLGQPDRLVAYRGGHRWVQTAEPTPGPRSARALPLRKHGVYLVTGGLGGIGLALAAHLARRSGRPSSCSPAAPPCRPRRSGPAQAGQRRRWHRRGCAWTWCATSRRLAPRCCTSRPTWPGRDEMEAAVAQARASVRAHPRRRPRRGRGGRGHHPLKEPEACGRARHGAQGPRAPPALEEAPGRRAAGLRVPLLVHGALLGGFGQVDYCAANAFLDAFAHACGRAGPASDLGELGRLEGGGDGREHARLRRPAGRARAQPQARHRPAEGVDAFAPDPGQRGSRRSWSSPWTYAAACSARWGEARGREAEAEEEALRRPRRTEHEAEPRPRRRRPRAAIVAPGRRSSGRGDIGADDNFFELGGDSLTALQAIAVMKASPRARGPDRDLLRGAHGGRCSRRPWRPRPTRRRRIARTPSKRVEQRADTRRELLERRRRQRGGARASRSVVEEP